jgi:hypothetical protein
MSICPAGMLEICLLGTCLAGMLGICWNAGIQSGTQPVPLIHTCVAILISCTHPTWVLL